MKKTSIDVNLYLCPKNPKHSLRKSSSGFCDLWCDQCKNGWAKANLRMKNQEADEKSFFVVTKKEDYDAIKVVIDKAALTEIKQYHKIVMQEEMRFAKIQAKITLKQAPIAYDEILFSEDPNRTKLTDFRYLLRKRMADHAHNFPHLPCDKNSLSQNISPKHYVFEISSSGVQLVPSRDSWDFKDETSVIGWELLK